MTLTQINEQVNEYSRLVDVLEQLVSDAQIDADIRDGKRCIAHGMMMPCQLCKKGNEK